MYILVIIYYQENDILHIIIKHRGIRDFRDGKISEEKLRRRYGRKPTDRDGYNIYYTYYIHKI